MCFFTEHMILSNLAETEGPTLGVLPVTGIQWGCCEASIFSHLIKASAERNHKQVRPLDSGDWTVFPADGLRELDPESSTSLRLQD